MDKVKNMKEKFYLLKKHLRNEQFETLQKYSNVSLFKILNIIKKNRMKKKKKNKFLEMKRINFKLFLHQIKTKI